MAVTAPLRPSKRVGRLIKEEGQGMAGVLPSGSCLPPGTSRTRELLLLFLACAVTYTGTNAPCASTVSRRHFDSRYVYTYVRIRERARYNSVRTTWPMPLAGLQLTLSLTHESWIFFAVWCGERGKRISDERRRGERAREEKGR